MRVAIDGVGNRYGGGLHVLHRTVEHVARDPRVDEVVVFVGSQVPGRQIDGVEWVRVPDDKKAMLEWWQGQSWWEVTQRNCDVALCMNGRGPMWGMPNVVLVQQALAFCRGREVRLSNRMRARMLLVRMLTKSCLEHATAVVVQSRWMRSLLLEHFGSLRADPTVLPLGVVPYDGGEPERDPVVACITGMLSYKNMTLAEEAERRLAARLPDAEVTIWANEQQRPYRYVAHLFQNARVSFAPSMVESLGLPLLESLASGCPVVAVDRPHTRDVCDDAAIYVDPHDPSDAAARLEEVLLDDALRADLQRRGRRRLESIWNARPYERLVDLLEEVRR